MTDLSFDARVALRDLAGGSPGRAVRLSHADVAGLHIALDSLRHATPGEAAERALTLARSLAAKAAVGRYEAFLELVPAYLARAAHEHTGNRLGHTITLWESATALTRSALGLSLDPQSVAFRLAELIIDLPPAREGHLEVA